MKHLTLFLCLFLPALLAAQSNCDYDKLLREGKTFAKQRQYKKALYKYNSARRCDRDKGEEVDAAIEALLDQVEGEKKAADKALEDLRATSGKVVESLLRDAENEIYHLRYPEALEKMNAAAEIGQKKPEVARALMEIAFFYAESGRFLEAKDITTTAARLLGKDAGLTRIDTGDAPITRRAFRQVLNGLDPVCYAACEARYYPVMIPVKGSEFILGCEKGAICDTMPLVKLSDFQLARTETTFWQFGLYTAATGRKIQRFSPDWGLDGDNPVVNVMWYQAIEYANWLSVQQGLQSSYIIDSLQQDSNNTSQFDLLKWSIQRLPNINGYHLPTEAEWEYAAGGGARRDTFVYSGSDKLADVAWYAVNSDTLGIRRTHPVSIRMPNSLGFCDMTGNVSEMCWDRYGIYLPYRYENPTGWPDGVNRCMRGGSWSGYDFMCILTFRSVMYPASWSNQTGFRLARH